MKDSITLDELKEYYLDNNYNENMFNDDGTINPNYNSSKKTGVLAQILEDHWDYVYQKHKDGIDRNRPNAHKEIQ